jgi:signal peptidase I
MYELIESPSGEFYSLGKDLVVTGISVRVRVRGQSMYPFIRDGDVVEVVPVSAEAVAVGDVVFFRAGYRLFAHRVFRCMTDGQSVHLLTRGDNHKLADSPIRDSRDLVGKVGIVYRGCRIVKLDQGMAALLGRAMARSSVIRWCVRQGGRLWKRGERLAHGLSPSHHQEETDVGPINEGRP